MSIKKTAAGITAIAVLCLCGCSSEPEKEPLSFGFNFGYPPFEYYSEDDGSQTGIDVDLANAIADRLDMKAEIVETSWSEIFEGVNKKQYDCAISAITITDERLLNYDFSDPYITNYQCILTLKDAEFKPNSPEETAGLKIGVQEETTSDIFISDFALSNGFEFNRFAFATASDVFTDLEAGRLDALVCDSMVAECYLNKSDLFEMTWIQENNPEEFAICIKKGNAELLEKINSALDEIKSDGTLDEIINKYFSE